MWRSCLPPWYCWMVWLVTNQAAATKQLCCVSVCVTNNFLNIHCDWKSHELCGSALSSKMYASKTTDQWMLGTQFGGTVCSVQEQNNELGKIKAVVLYVYKWSHRYAQWKAEWLVEFWVMNYLTKSVNISVKITGLWLLNYHMSFIKFHIACFMKLS